MVERFIMDNFSAFIYITVIVMGGICWVGGFYQRIRQESVAVKKMNAGMVMLKKEQSNAITIMQTKKECDKITCERNDRRKNELKRICTKMTAIESQENIHAAEIFKQLGKITFFMGRVEEHMNNTKKSGGGNKEE